LSGSPGIISLITDFGDNSHYVGTMKGAILSVNPDTTIVDISHGISPHNILEGALALKAAYSYFPYRTTHVVVVDPGVGGPRRPLLVTSERYLFVGPDNGVLSLVMDEIEAYTCYHLTAAHYFRADVSPVFHGRDIFGPVAGWLTRGIRYEHLGDPVDDPVRIAFPKVAVSDGQVEGEVIHGDRFGNLITSIAGRDLESLPGSGAFRCRVGASSGVTVPVVTHYGLVGKGSLCALIGSSGFLEVAVNQGRAADIPGARPGLRVAVARG
jgi:S-adenosylmethionine hydrolase